MSSKQKIAILGGSFNPPHLGHFAICEWIKKNNIAEDVWIIPCFVHPFNKEILDFEHRIKMCELAFSHLYYVKISDVEKKLGGISTTVNTLKYLNEKFDVKFKLIVGSDVESEFPKWTDLEKIKQLAEIIVVKRGGDSIIPDISATRIRNLVKNGKDISNFVSVEVKEYILKNNLYKK